MSRASILNQLSDEQLDQVRHAIRRDAKSDLEIARMAADMLTLPIVSESASAMVIARYRASRAYQRWLKDWEGRDVELRKAIELQKQRFEFLSELVKGTDRDANIEAVSKNLQARLLTLASELTDDELRDPERCKWIRGLLTVVAETTKQDRASKATQLKAELGATREGSGLSQAEIVEKVDRIMGLKK